MPAATQCTLWGSERHTRRWPMVIGRLWWMGMIAVVSLRLLYLIFLQVLSLILLLGRTASSKDVELLVCVTRSRWFDCPLQHAAAASSAAAAPAAPGVAGPRVGPPHGLASTGPRRPDL